ncbi:Lactonase, 7-bladed beta-propeller [Insolitispirillum peregrinum]|uniref:Lactonase, 7-bladed beta-propeller n=2 Tax=Insolitispirillum peregrinum TaxID=80876 RepID=A0A1N7QCN5_9PROT|nr:Lactonase, 7-bladed beta-propeller [Insolitispirillum peregrinum]
MSGHHASQKTPKLPGTPKFLALALESRMMFDAAVAATAEAVAVAATDTAPGVTATAEKPTATLNDTVTTATVDLFSGVTVATDTSGTDSSLGTLVVTVDRSGSNQALVVDGTTITLENGATGATTSKGYAYSVSTSGGTTTVTIGIAASGASTASDVASLIDGIAYTALDNTVESGTVTVTLKSLSDSTDTASLDISAAVTVDNDTVAESNDAPVVTATPATAAYSEDSDPLSLFANASVSTVESGQTITSLTFTVSGLADGASESLTVDGTSIALVAGSGTTSSGHAYTVTLSGTTATLVVSSSTGMAAADAASLVDGVTYANSAATLTEGNRVVTLASVRDSGGTANDGQDTTALTIAATVTVERAAPNISAETGSLSYNDLIKATAEDGYTNLLDGIRDVVAVDDLVYVIRTTTVWDSSTFTEVPVSTLYVFQRAADGTLALSQTIDSTSVSALVGATEITVSTDGTTVQVLGDSGVVLFGRTSDTGALTALGSIGADVIGDRGAITSVLATGNTVYVTAGESLLVFTLAQDGTLTLGQTLSDAGTAGVQLDGANSLALSADGQWLVVGTLGGGTLASVFRVGTDGTLTFVSAALGPDATADQAYYTSALALSADGKTVYASEYDGSAYHLYVLSLDGNGTLAPQSVLTLDKAVSDLIVSSDGAALFVIGANGIKTYARSAGGTLTLLGEATTYGTYSLSGLNGASLSADGTQIYLTGTFSWNAGLMVLDLKPAASTYSEGGTAVALMPAATLSDPQLDAANNGAGDYNGASVVIERQGGAVSEDQFGFLAGDGLTFDSASGTIQRDGQAIATVTQSAGSLTITFTASVSTAEAQSVLRRVTYANTSDDPTRNSSTAAFTVTINDGTGHHDSMTAEVTLIGVNDPPVITTTAQTPTYNAEGERVSLFKDTSIDTVEAGQSIWRVILTLDAVTANDVLGVDGGKINLDTVTSGTQSTGTGLSYSVSVVDGRTTVTLYLMKSASEAAALIDSLTYGNTGSALNGTRTVTLAVMEYADGNVNTTTIATAQAVVTLAAATAANTAPTVGGIPPVSYTEQAAAILLAPAGTVADAQMDAFNGGKGNYDGAVLTITLGEGRSGVDSLGFTAGNGLTLENGRLSKDGVVIATVTNADGVLTITFTDANGTIPTTSDVQNTLQQITYADSSDTPAATVAVTITLSDQRGLVSSDATVSIAVTGINDAPAVTQDPVAASGTIDLSTIGAIEGLGTLTAAVVSADGTTVYVADGSGAIALLVRDASTGALTYVRTFATMTGGAGLSDLVLSADGRSLYALRADGNALVWFAVDASGSLAHQQTIVDDYSVTDGNLWGVKDIAVSEDGANLYLINGYNVVTFSRDPATGALTYVEAIVGSAWSAPYLWTPTEIVTRGDLVYVVTDPSFSSVLIVYTRGDDGSLSLLAHTQSGASALQDIQEITVSADGGTIYVAGASTISRFTLDAENGVLTYQGNVTTTQGVTDIALSGDGLTLYVTLEGGTLARYATSGDSLHLADSQTLAGAGAISTTSGGVIVLGSGLTSVQESAITPTYVIGQTPVSFASDYSLSDPELDAANGSNGEYQGASVTVSEASGQGSFGFASDSGLSLSGGTLSLNGTAIATVSSASGTLTLTFLGGVTTETANLVLHSLTYANEAATASTTATLTITLNDGQVSGAARTVGVSVIEINDAPTLSATAASGTIDTANGGAVTLFSEAAIDTVESGQSITSLTLVVSGVSDGAGEILVVDGTDIPLTTGSIRTTNGHTVTVVLVNGTASVTLSNTSGIAVADARTLVNAIAYKGADTATLTAGERTITLTSVRDSGGTVQGGVDTTTLSIAATVRVVYVNDAPSLVTTPATGASHTAGDRPVLLFGGTVIDAGESEQAIRALTLTVSGLHDGDGDALMIDGTTVAMTSGTVTTAHGLSVTVTVSDGTATVTVSKAAGMTTAEAAALVDGIAYGTVPDGTMAVGQRVVTLVSIQDIGGTADNGVDTSTLTISATVDIPDAAPVATTCGLSLTVIPGTAFSTTLAETLVRHPNGDALTWAVDGLPEGLSFDPETRIISGMVSATGTYALTITVTDSNGESTVIAVSLSVRVPTSDTAGPSPVLDTGNGGSAGPFPMGSAPQPGMAAEMTSSAPLAVGTLSNGFGANGSARTDAAIAAAPLSFLLPVGEQFSTATSLVSDSASSTSPQAAFDRQGDVWVATVAAATAAGNEVRVSIPAEIQGTAVTVRLANGLPLPAWVRFDRSTGQIIVDARQLSRLQQLRLQMQTRDANGVARDTVLEIRPEPKVTASGRTPDQTIASAETTIIPTPADPAPQAEPQPGLAMQLDAPRGLLEEARALLASLTGHRQVA